MSDRETALRRVQKLLALSKSPNEHEATAAAALAQELMQKHKIEERDLEAEGDVVVESWSYANRTVMWKRDLAFAVARAFFCRCVHGLDGEKKAWCHFVGRRQDIDVAKAVYEYLLRELQRLSAESLVKHKEAAEGLRSRGILVPKPDGRSWCSSFLAGAVNRVAARFREQDDQAKEVESGRALMVINEELDKKLPEIFSVLEEAPPASEVRDVRAWVDGDKTGREILLKPPVELEGGAT